MSSALNTEAEVKIGVRCESLPACCSGAKFNQTCKELQNYKAQTTRGHAELRVRTDSPMKSVHLVKEASWEWQTLSDDVYDHIFLFHLQTMMLRRHLGTRTVIRNLVSTSP